MRHNKNISPILYSVGTELAFRIEKKYYNDVHYVWCTESFNSEEQPGTSRPAEICRRYLMQLSTGDCHAQEISNNKAGILLGARDKLNCNVISKKEFEEISNIVASADFDTFFPVLYIIDSKKVEKRCIKVLPSDCASDASIEYKIKDLKKNEFQIIFTRDFLSGVIKVAKGKAPGNKI